MVDLMGKLSIKDDSILEDDILNIVYLIIRRKKVTLHIDTLENTSVLDLKKMIGDILNLRPADQQLFLVSANDSSDKYVELDDSNILSNYKLDTMTASLINPAILGLAVRQEDGSFEKLEMTPYSETEWPKLSDISTTKDGRCDEKTCADYREKYDRMLEELSEIKPVVIEKRLDY